MDGLIYLMLFLLWCYGVLRSFQASCLLGLVSLFIAPVAMVAGVIALLSKDGKL